MKTLTVILKQHTPLIHFQHYQEGATLRASEVKPRLDRYILEKLGKGNYAEGCSMAAEKKWLVGTNPLKKEQFALNYKMRIEPENYQNLTLKVSPNKKSKYETENFPMLLSNMGGKNDKSDLVNFSMYDNISIKFQFFNNTNNLQEIYNTIKDNIELFFLTRNFGQRASKGFGSFTVESIKEDFGEAITINTSNSISELKTCIIRYEYQNSDQFSTLFNIIDFYWKCLKSGVNSTKRIIVNNKIERKYSDKTDEIRYIKSYLWTFLNDRGYTWEKRTIKQLLGLSSSPATNDKKEYRDNNNNIFYARAFLGCPINGFTYRIATGKIEKYQKKEKTEEKEKIINKEIDIKCSNENIKRIPSPILFKPIIHGINGKIHVSILILIDKNIVESLYALKDKNIKFTFNKIKYDKSQSNNKEKKIEANININLFAKDKYMIDFQELIKEYHNHMQNKLEARDYKWEKILKDRQIELITI